MSLSLLQGHFYLLCTIANLVHGGGGGGGGGGGAIASLGSWRGGGGEDCLPFPRNYSATRHVVPISVIVIILP